MTRTADGKLNITPRDIAKHPILLVVCLLGLGGGGTGAMSLFSIATKTDVQRIESKLDAVAGDVADLKVEARAREIAEAKKLSHAENIP